MIEAADILRANKSMVAIANLGSLAALGGQQFGCRNTVSGEEPRGSEPGDLWIHPQGKVRIYVGAGQWREIRG